MSSLPKPLLLLLVTDITRVSTFLGIYFGRLKNRHRIFCMLYLQKLSMFLDFHSHTSSYGCCASRFDVESGSKTASSDYLDNQVLIAFQFPTADS